MLIDEFFDEVIEINPTIDFVIKRLIADDRHIHATLHLVNAVVQFPNTLNRAIMS